MQPRYLVDHRYANSQIRYRLLQMVVTGTLTLEDIANKSGLTVHHLTRMCLRKSAGVSYMNMAKLAKALFGADTKLRVSLPWVECGFSWPEKEPCAEDQECERLLELGQQNKTIPEKVQSHE